MAQNIKIVIIAILVSFGAIFFALNVPAQWFSLAWLFPSHSFGTVSLTTLNPTDNLSNFPTTYNSNNTALNNGKVDVSDLQATTTLKIPTLSSLSSIGTITVGTWNGSTIGAAYGGTGSTTLSANELFMGNGTGQALSVGWGISGQALVSNGPAVAPTFQSLTFDNTLNYALTGNWNFVGNTLIKNLIASTTITVNNGGNPFTVSIPTGGIPPIASTTAYTATGTYNKTSGVQYVCVQVWGGGGGGGGFGGTLGSTAVNVTSGAGGGGEYTQHCFTAAAISSPVTVTVGGGGPGGIGANSGSVGTDSTFGTYLTGYAGGGGGGIVANNATNGGGGGGGGSLGDGGVGGNAGGSNGTAGTAGNPSDGMGWGGSVGAVGASTCGGTALFGGGGGAGSSANGCSSIYGAGGGAAGLSASGGASSNGGGTGGASVAVNTTPGNAGSVPGGGGGGVERNSSGSALTGGAGAAGEVIITEIF